ncbi:MAG: flagellar biosynthesis protein FliQ [Lachnospiraceae bacterium]|nr:flagellar biosynthesis protein FliQ [Lachnospiraceae bacterium]
MSGEVVIDIIRETFYVVILCSAPMLLVSLILGLTVSVFQTVTSIQEQTLTFVPKFVGIFLIIMLLGQWIGGNITGFMEELWSDFTLYIR